MFQNFTVENKTSSNGETYSHSNDIKNNATILKLINNQLEYENNPPVQNTVYENTVINIRQITVYSLKSLDKIGSLYKLLKDAINNPNVPPIPLLFRYCGVVRCVLLCSVVGCGVVLCSVVG